MLYISIYISCIITYMLSVSAVCSRNPSKIRISDQVTDKTPQHLYYIKTKYNPTWSLGNAF